MQLLPSSHQYLSPRLLLPARRYMWVAPYPLLQSEGFWGGQPGNSCQALGAPAGAKGEGPSAGREASKSRSGVPWGQAAGAP